VVFIGKQFVWEEPLYDLFLLNLQKSKVILFTCGNMILNNYK
jgi:hypothetical protein